MDATIYTAYHKSAPLLGSASVVPIHVGRARAKSPLPGMIGDDTGDHISDRNPAYCELTALYWAWKQTPPEKTHVGLMHYRRVLDVTDQSDGKSTEDRVARFDIAPWLAGFETWIGTAEVDIVVPRPHRMGRTLEGNYRRAHQPQDFEAARAIIAADHPEFLPAFEKSAAEYDVRLGNMFLMRRDLFDRYCTWLFDILFKVEAQPFDRRNYTPQQGRYIGYLAERLFTIWLAHIAETEPEITIKDVSILNLSQGLIVPYSDGDRFTQDNDINIAMAADPSYVPHAAAMLRSLIDHVDQTRPLNVFLLHDNVSDKELAALDSVLKTHKRASLHPLNTADAFSGFYRSASRAPSNATYNRFLLFSLLPKVKRLLYLDADMIVLRDVAPLFDTPMDGAALAAVPDWIMTRTLTGPIPTIDPEVPDLSAYQRDKLGLSDAQMGHYVNAGVLLFNFEALENPVATGEALIEKARQGGYLFRDQDILNAHFADQLKVLDGRWNVFNSRVNAFDRVPAENHAKAMAARSEPWIIHFADRAYKPWNGDLVPQAELYWQALIRTPFYGPVIASLNETKLQAFLSRIGRESVVRAKAFVLRYPVLKGPLLRVYTRLGLSKR